MIGLMENSVTGKSCKRTQAPHGWTHFEGNTSTIADDEEAIAFLLCATERAFTCLIGINVCMNTMYLPVSLKSFLATGLNEKGLPSLLTCARAVTHV